MSIKNLGTEYTCDECHKTTLGIIEYLPVGWIIGHFEYSYRVGGSFYETPDILLCDTSYPGISVESKKPSNLFFKLLKTIR